VVTDYVNIWESPAGVRVSEFLKDMLAKRKARKELWLKRRYNNLSLMRKVRQKQFDRTVKKMREDDQPKKLVLLNLD